MPTAKSVQFKNDSRKYMSSDTWVSIERQESCVCPLLESTVSIFQATNYLHRCRWVETTL